MRMKKFISLLLVCCTLIGLLPTVTLADDSQAVTNYHIFTDLPTKEGGESTANLYLGAFFNGVLYGMNGSGFSSNAATSTTDVAAQNKITVLYGGEDATYGTYYYLCYTLPNGTAYTFAYAGGYFSQNKLTNGLPSGGWAAKHKMFYDAEAQIFYHRPSADMTVMKGLKVSSSSYKLFTETVANLKKESTSYVPARVYAVCTSDNIAGSDATHTWSGSCSCGYKFDYQEKTEETFLGFHQQSVLPTAENPEIGGNLYLGAAIADTFYGMNGSGFASNAATTSTDDAVMNKITVLYGGEDDTYGTYYYLCYTLPNGTAYAFAYAGGYFSQNKLTDGLPSDGWGAKHKLFFDAEAQLFYHRPAADMTVMKGLKISTASYSIFTETVANLKKPSAAYVPARLYASCSAMGEAGSDETHHWEGICACGDKVGYAPHDEITEWNVKTPEGHGKICVCGYEVEAIQPHEMPEQWTEDPETGLVYMYCDACSYRALKDHTHAYTAEKFDENGHWTECICGDATEAVSHTMSQWAWETQPETLADTGIQKRNCEHCQYSETREATLSTADFKVSANPAAANVPFYLGATQLQIENTPTYYFKGVWAPSKYVNMDVTTDMYAAQAMYAEKTQGGYKLYFDNEGVKTYLIIADMTVNDSKGVFVQPVTDAKEASVFKWNNQYGTYQTTVPGKGDYYIGLYTDKGTAYTKLQPLLVSGLGREDRHPGKIYMKTEAADHTHSFSQWEVISTPVHLQDQGQERRECSLCGYEEIRITTLSAADYAVSANPPAANVPFYLGATQLQVANKPTYFFKGEWAASKYVNMEVTTDMTTAKALYAEETEGGYKLYFDNNGTKTYLIVADMTVNDSKGVFVQPVTDASKASVFTWNNNYGTYQTNVAGKGDYYIGLYTDKGVTYTKLQPLLVSGLGREDRHPGKIYMRTGASDHAHSFADWTVLSTPNHLQDQGKETRKCSICGYEEIRVITLSAQDFQASKNPPATGVPFYLGATQRQIKDKPTYFFKGQWAASKYINMEVSTKIEEACALYAEAVNGGYKLYFDNNGEKTYLYIANTTVNGAKGVFVQPTTSAAKASVFLWHDEYYTFYTNVPEKGDYYIGLYTDQGVTYTKLQPLLVSGLGRDDRHAGRIYLRTYEQAGHTHTFGAWVSKSYPTHLNDQGVQERACTGCDYVQGRVVMLSASDYKPATSAPRSGSTFYLGAAQLQMENAPAYFFLGQWLPRKMQRMDVTDDLKKSALMYVEAADGGYKLYFMNEGVKTYLTIAETRVNGDKGVFVQPVTEASEASVFQWNQKFGTYQTRVEGMGDYCIGNYTDGDIKYTKLSALPVSGLESDHFHAAVPYVLG